MIFFSFSSCGNLLNEEAITSPSGINEPGPLNDINTFFDKTFSTSAAINIQTKYDEYLISGSPIGENDIEDIWITSLDHAGSVIFESTFRTGKHLRIVSQIIDQEKNYIFICNEFDPSTYKADIFILKITPDKQIKWHYKLGNSTSTYALSAVMLSGGTIAITAQTENVTTSNYDPILIKINPYSYTISSIRLDYQVSSLSGNVYPVPVKILSDENDTLTIAGYYFDSSNKSRIAVIKMDSDDIVISKYILYEYTKNLSILDIKYQNPTYDILLICKSDTLHGRDEGFTLLKVFKDSSIKFENDYIINGFTPADNIIAMSDETFSVGGYLSNGTSDYSVSLITFNYSGNINNFQSIESGITEINRINFSREINNNYMSYIYSCKKLDYYSDKGIVSRRIALTGIYKKNLKPSILLNKDNSSGETLFPVEINDITVIAEDIEDIVFKPVSDLNIEWK